MFIERTGYLLQPPQLHAKTTNKTQKRFLRSVYNFYKSDYKKSGTTVPTLEDFFMLDPFLFMRLKNDWKPGLAAIVDRKVYQKTIHLDINYVMLSAEQLDELMAHFTNWEHVVKFDKGLERFLVKTEKKKRYFSNTGVSLVSSRNPKTELSEDDVAAFLKAAREFRTLKSIELFFPEGFDLYGGYYPTLDHFESDASSWNTTVSFTRKIMRDFRKQCEDVHQFHTDYPAFSAVLGEMGMGSELALSFILSPREQARFNHIVSSCEDRGSANLSGLSVMFPDDYNFLNDRGIVSEFKDECRRRGILDEETNAVYIVRYPHMQPSHYKVGVTNYNHSYVRLKNVRNDYVKALKLSGLIEEETPSSEIVASELKIYFVGGEGAARQVEANIHRSFPMAETGLTEHPNFPYEEVRDLSSDPDDLKSIFNTLEQKELAALQKYGQQFAQRIVDPTGSMGSSVMFTRLERPDFHGILNQSSTTQQLELF